MKKLLLTALLLVPQMQAMEMGAGNKQEKNATCSRLATACCLGFLIMGTTPVNAIYQCSYDEARFPEQQTCYDDGQLRNVAPIIANPCRWNPQYQSVHFHTFEKGLFGQKVELPVIWDSRSGQCPEGCADDVSSGSITDVMKRLGKRNDRMRIQECEELHTEFSDDWPTARYLAQEARRKQTGPTLFPDIDIVPIRFLSYYEQTVWNQIRKRDEQREVCRRDGITQDRAEQKKYHMLVEECAALYAQRAQDEGQLAEFEGHLEDNNFMYSMQDVERFDAIKRRNVKRELCRRIGLYTSNDE
jgi:hypothetical protein